jgi:hypothetical protein
MPISRMFGLDVRSDLSLTVPEADKPEELDRSSHRSVDVEVKIGPLPRHVSDSQNGPEHLSDAPFEGSIEGIARFRISPHSIVVDPEPGVNEMVLRSILWGSAITIVLQQRGYLVLHASCVAISNKAIAFLGSSGAGKSTLASAFQRQGYPVLTDDVLAIRFQDGQPIAYSSIAPIKLLPDAAIALGENPEHLPALQGVNLKVMQRISIAAPQETYFLSKLYLLGIGQHHRISNLSGAEALLSLIYHSRDHNTLKTQARQAPHFDLCSQLVKSTPFSRLERRKSLDELALIVSHIEQDLRLRPSC